MNIRPVVSPRWFCDAQREPCQVLDRAYQEALSTFAHEVKQSSEEWTLIRSQTTIESVRGVLHHAKSQYEGKKSPKTSQRLQELLERISYYGSIMDVLVQHHPEYVALAWGALKLVFTTFLNHEETIRKLAKAFTLIASSLPRCELTLILYPTVELEAAVAEIYIKILRFTYKAIGWYHESSLKHVISAVWQPWSLKFQPDIEDIIESCRELDRMAALAAQTELRTTRLIVEDNARGIAHISNAIDTRSQFDSNMSMFLQIKLETLEKHVSLISQNMNSSFGVQNKALVTVQLNQLLSLPMWSSLPTSGDSLMYCQSLEKRSVNASNRLLPDYGTLNTWLRVDTPGLLCIRGPPGPARSVALQVTNHLTSSNVPVIWAHRFQDYWKADTTLIGVVRMLLFQLLQQISVFGDLGQVFGGYPITVAHLRNASTLREYVGIFERAAMSLRHVFVIIDGALLSHQEDKDDAIEFIELMQAIKGTTFKFIFVGGIIKDCSTKRVGSLKYRQSKRPRLSHGSRRIR